MAINLKTQVAIDVELNTEFKEAQDFKLVTTAAVALKDAIENIGRAHLQTEKGYKAHIKLLQAEKENLLINSQEYLDYVKAIAQTEERLKSLTKVHQDEAKALAILNNSAAATTKEFEKSISVIDKTIQQRREHLGLLQKEAEQQITAGEVNEDFLNYLDKEKELLDQSIDLRNKLTEMLEQNTVAVNINSQAQQILTNSYKSTVNGISAQKKALTEVFNQLTNNDQVFLDVAASIRKLDEETQQLTQHLQTSYTSAEAYNKASELMKTTTFNTTNEINKQKNALAELLGFIQISSGEYSKVKTEIEQLTQKLQTSYTSTEAYNKALDLMKTKTFNTTNEINKQKNALAELLGFIQIGSGAYSKVKTEIEQLTQEQKIANNEFLKGSKVVKQFLDQFAGRKNNESLKKLQKDLDAATDTTKIERLQAQINKLSKPIKISEITDVNNLKQIIEAYEILSVKVSNTSSDFRLLQTIFEEAQQRINTLGNTTQNVNEKINATLKDIQAGLNLNELKPVDLLEKFKNIEQVGEALSRLKALQSVINIQQQQGKIVVTKPEELKNINNLISGLEELKQIMTEVVYLQEKPLTFTQELEKLKETVPTTVSAVNELSNAYTELLNKVQVRADEDLDIFTIAKDDIENIREIQRMIELSSFVAQKLKREVAEIFVGLKGGERDAGLESLLFFANQARSVNELQLAISKLESLQNELPYIGGDEKTVKVFDTITRKIDELKQKYKELQESFTQESFTQELEKLQKTVPTTVGAINQLENAYAALLNKVSVTQQTGTSLFNINSDDIAQVTQIQKEMLQASIAAQKLKQNFASIFVGENRKNEIANRAPLQKQQENLSNQINKLRNDEIQLLQQQQQEQAKLNELTKELKSIQKIKKFPFIPESENLIKKLIIEILQTKYSIESLGTSIANTNNELIVLEHNLNNTTEQLEDIQQLTGLEDLFNFADEARSVNELQLAISKLESLKSELPYSSDDETVKVFEEITRKIDELTQKYKQLQESFNQITLTQELEKLEKTVPATVSAVNELSNAYTQLLNKVQVNNTGVPGIFTIADDDIEDIRKIQHSIEVSAFAAQKLKGEFAEIFVGLKGEERGAGLESLLFFADQARSVNELQLAISKLQNLQNELPYIEGNKKTVEIFEKITLRIYDLTQKYKELQELFKQELPFNPSTDGINQYISELQKLKNSFTEVKSESEKYKQLLNDINKLQVAQQLGQIRDQDQQYQLDAVDEALSIGKEEFKNFNLAQLESYLQLLERLQKNTLNNTEGFEILARRIKEVNEQLQKQQAVGQETLSFWEQLKRRIMGVDTELDSLQIGSEDFLQTIEMVSYQFDNFLTRGIGDSIRSFAEIQAEILRVTATAGDATEAEMTKISQTATMAASATSKEVANIMLIGARAGLDKTQIEQFTQPIIAGMEATGTTAETMASTVIDSLRAFRIPFSDTMKTVDLFTNVANKSNQEVKDIADALRYVGPYAASLNVDITDLGAVLAILANAGIRGTEAGTGLRMALSRLAIAANATSGETLGLTENQDRLFRVMKQLGINIRDEEGNLKSLVDVLVMLKKETENYTSTQKAELVTALFGIESAGKLIAALNLTEIELRMTGEQIANNTGLTKKLQQEINGTDYQLKQFSNSLSLLSTEFGKAFATAMSPFTKALTELFNGFNKMSPEAKQVAASIAALTASFVILISTVTVYLALKSQIAAAALLFGQALGTVTGAVKGLTAAFTGLFAVSNFTGPAAIAVLSFGKIAIAIAAVTTALVILSKAFGDANEEKDKFVDTSSFSGLNAALKGIHDLLKDIKNLFAEFPTFNPFALPKNIEENLIKREKEWQNRKARYETKPDIEKVQQLFPENKYDDKRKLRALTAREYGPFAQTLQAAIDSKQFKKEQIADFEKILNKDAEILFRLGWRHTTRVNELLKDYTPTKQTQEIIENRLKLFKEAQQLIQGIQKNKFIPEDFLEIEKNQQIVQLERLKTALIRIGADNENTIEPLINQLDTLFTDPTDAAINKFQTYIELMNDNTKNALAEAVNKTVKVNEDAIRQISGSVSDVRPLTDNQNDLTQMLEKIDKIREEARQKEIKAQEDATQQLTKIESEAIDRLKEINIEAANSIDKYKKDNIEKLAKFTIEKERQIQDARLQIQKNQLTALRNQQDFQVNMEMISRRLRGESTTDLEYKYRLERILQDKEQALEDVRYNRIKDVKDLEQEIIEIRKQGEKEIYEIWSTLWTKRQETIRDAQKQQNDNNKALERTLNDISEAAASALKNAYGSSTNVENFTPTIIKLGDQFYDKDKDINKLLEKAGLTKEQFETYRNVLHYRETREYQDPYKAVNKQTGYAGAYQFGTDVQQDAINLAKTLKVDTKGLTGQIKEIAPLKQEKLLLLTIGVYRQQLERYIENFNQLPLDVQIGLLFASHGHGAEATAKFYKKGTNAQDQNNVNIKDTFTRGKNIFQQQSNTQSILPTPQWRLATGNTRFGIGGPPAPLLVVPNKTIEIPPPPPISLENQQEFTKILQNSETQFDTSIRTIIPEMPTELKELGEEQIKPFVTAIEKVIAVTKELQQSEIDVTSSNFLKEFSDYANDIVNPVTQISDNYYTQQKLLQEQQRLMAQGVNPELIEQTAQLNIQKQTEAARLTILQQTTGQLISQTQENIKQNNERIIALKNETSRTDEQQKELENLERKNTEYNNNVTTLTSIQQITKDVFDLNEKLPDLIEKQRKEFEKLEEQKQRIKDLSTGIANTLGEGLRESLNLIINGSENWGLALENIVVKMLNQIIDQLLYITVIQPFVKGATDFLQNIFKNMFADGGIMTQDGPMPLKRYAYGGIANSPQLAMFGEGSKPEAYVPLPDGRSIPVTIQSPIKNSDNKTTINNISVTVSNDSSQTQGSDSKSRRLGEELALKIQQEIIRQQRPGGLLA